MTGGTTVGFMPVAGAGSVSFGTSAKTGAEIENPLGLFSALLQFAAQATGAAPEGPPPISDDQARSLAALFSTTKGGGGEALAEGTPTDAPPTDAPRELAGETLDPSDVSSLFPDVIDAIAALQQVSKTAEPVDPLLEQRAVELLDKLGAALGLKPADVTPQQVLLAATPPQLTFPLPTRTPEPP